MRTNLAGLLFLAIPIAVNAQADSAAFVVRLGHDTTAIERYVRTGDVITAEALQRSPSTQLHRLQLRLGPDGRIRSGEYQLLPPGGGQPLASRTFEYGDSLVVQLTQGGTSRRVALASAPAIPVIGPFYLPYELALQQFRRGTAQSGTVPLLTGTSLGQTEVRRLAGDSLGLTNQFGEPMTARLDANGRLLRIHTPAYVTVERTRWVDVPALAREFAARDASGRGLGALSPRSTVRSRVGEANIWLDYSRPGARGRPIWGALVRFGEVWRLGANDATHLSTDRPLQLGELTLQPGTYTLFLLPTGAEAWSLVVNRRTGIGGLDYDPAADVGRVPMTVQAAAPPVEQLIIGITGGNTPRLEIAWGDKRGFVPVSVQ